MKQNNLCDGRTSQLLVGDILLDGHVLSCAILCNYVLWLVSTVGWSCLVLYNTM